MFWKVLIIGLFSAIRHLSNFTSEHYIKQTQTVCLCTIGKKQLWPLHPKRCYSTHPLLQSNTWNLKQLKCVHAKKYISIWIWQSHNSTSTYAYNTTKGQINIMLTCGSVFCFLKSRTSEASPTKTLIKMATSNSSALINISNAFSTTLVVLCLCVRAFVLVTWNVQLKRTTERLWEF